MKRWSRIAIILSEPAFGRINAATLAKMMDAMERRVQIQWKPTTLGAVVAFAWIIAYGRITDALEKTRWNVLNPESVSETIHLMALLMGMPFAICLGFIAGGELRRRLLRRTIRRHLETPLCFWCGYALIGLTSRDETNLITCPECGRKSAVAAAHHGISN